MKYLNSMTFQVLHDLYKPCSTYASKHRPLLIHQKATAITLLLSTRATVKKKSKYKHNQHFFWDYAFPPIKRVTRKSQKAKEMHKKVCCTCKVFLLLLLFFFCSLDVLILVFVCVNYKHINESFPFSPG